MAVDARALRPPCVSFLDMTWALQVGHVARTGQLARWTEVKEIPPLSPSAAVWKGPQVVGLGLLVS